MLHPKGCGKIVRYGDNVTIELREMNIPRGRSMTRELTACIIHKNCHVGFITKPFLDKYLYQLEGLRGKIERLDGDTGVVRIQSNA